MEGLEEEHEQLKTRIKSMYKQKEDQVAEILELYNEKLSLVTQIGPTQKMPSASDYESNLMAAMKSMRKLPIFGTGEEEQIDFEWPTKKDLL